MSRAFQIVVANLNGKGRTEVLDEREYWVAPLSMIVPGVLNGSQGKLYYPLEEISVNYDAWNGMPMVANHPLDADGKFCSARSPEIIRKFGVGYVFNARVDGKLIAEGWFDVRKSMKVIPQQFAAIQRGESVEISTGLFTRNEPVQNGKTEDGKEYDAIARAYRPDHLAILTNQPGACSNRDGCGVNVNQLSHADLHQQLEKLIRQRYGMNTYLVDVFDKYAVYSVHTSEPGSFSNTSKHFRIDYTVDLRTGKVELSDQGSKEVIRETMYKSVTNSGCGTGAGGFKPGNTCASGKGGGSSSGFSVGDKVEISGGIFKGKKATVLGSTEEGVEVQFPNFKRAGRTIKGGKAVIPHKPSADKPTMTDISHLKKVSGKAGKKDSAGGDATRNERGEYVENAILAGSFSNTSKHFKKSVTNEEWIQNAFCSTDLCTVNAESCGDSCDCKCKKKCDKKKKKKSPEMLSEVLQNTVARLAKVGGQKNTRSSNSKMKKLHNEDGAEITRMGDSLHVSPVTNAIPVLRPADEPAWITMLHNSAPSAV